MFVNANVNASIAGRKEEQSWIKGNVALHISGMWTVSDNFA